jgi:hypothetical protein
MDRVTRFSTSVFLNQTGLIWASDSRVEAFFDIRQSRLDSGVKYTADLYMQNFESLRMLLR